MHLADIDMHCPKKVLHRKIGVDTSENELSKVWGYHSCLPTQNIYPSTFPSPWTNTRLCPTCVAGCAPGAAVSCASSYAAVFRSAASWRTSRRTYRTEAVQVVPYPVSVSCYILLLEYMDAGSPCFGISYATRVNKSCVRSCLGSATGVENVSIHSHGLVL